MGHFINVVFTQRCSEGGSQPNQACVMAAVRAYTSSQCPALSPDGISYPALWSQGGFVSCNFSTMLPVLRRGCLEHSCHTWCFPG